MQARVEEQRRERTYRIYVTDGLKVLAGFEQRYYDLAIAKPKVIETDAEKIKKRIVDKLACASEKGE